MPARQRGSVRKRGKTWEGRWYDAVGNRSSKGGFRSKTDARRFVDAQVAEVERVRLGDVLPRSRRPQTVNALLDAFLVRYEASHHDLTTTSCTRRWLNRPRREFGHLHPDALVQLDLEDWFTDLKVRIPVGAYQSFRTLRQAWL
jgi:hypothetical protein